MEAFYNKMPTDENLRKRGCIIVSMCSLCGDSEETALHLFLNYRFARQIWSWLSSIILSSLDLSSFQYPFSICDKSWSSRVRFNNPRITVLEVLSTCLLLQPLFLEISRRATHKQFSILSAFSVIGHACKVPHIKQVDYHFPFCG